jgi:hypothetical protein
MGRQGLCRPSGPDDEQHPRRKDAGGGADAYRNARLCNPDKTLASCDPAAAPPPEVLVWQKELATAGIGDATYAKALATELRNLVCASDTDVTHVLRGIIREEPVTLLVKEGKSSARLADPGREAPALVDFIMSKDCPVSASLTDDDRAKLLEIKQDAEKESEPPKASMEKK